MKRAVRCEGGWKFGGSLRSSVWGYSEAISTRKYLRPWNRCCHLGEYRKRWEVGIGPSPEVPEQELVGQEWVRGGGIFTLFGKKLIAENPGPLRHEWIKQILYIQTMEYCWALRRILMFWCIGTTCINFEGVMLHETNEALMNNCCMIPLMKYLV